MDARRNGHCPIRPERDGKFNHKT
jgi:hypothetical protein